MAEKKEKRYVSDNAQLMKEWDWEKNEKLELNPQYLLEGSNKKAYWICSSCGNEWMAQIQKRAVRGQGCPDCYKNKKYKIQQAFLYSRVEKEGSFADRYPELLKEWDWEENDKKSLNPYQLLEKSNKRVSWICSVCKSKWETQLEKRTIRSQGCPNCGKEKLRIKKEKEYKERLKQEGSFADKHPELLDEWDYNKNHKGPNEYLEGSNQTVYWVCSKCGYKWSARISQRSSGSGCKKCATELSKKTLLANLILQKGSLADNAPQLAEEWHSTKNRTVKPNDVMLNTNKSFWWKCRKCGYEWKTSPSNRNIGRGCPKCALEFQKCNMMKPILGENDLLSQCPELAQEWHPYKNGELTPKDVTKSANRKVWWLGKCGHEWEAVVGSRYLGRGCPICRKEFKISYPEKAIYYYLNKYCYNIQVIENYTAEWLQGKEIDIFIPSLNFGIEYDGENWHKNIDADREKDLLCVSNNVELLRIRESKAPRILSKNTFIIENPSDNEMELIKAIEFVFSFLKRNFDIDIQYEIDLKNDRTHIYELLELSKKEKSLLFLYPSIAKEWHPTKNGYLTPEYISAYSHKTFWWVCPKGHEYDMVVKHRVEKGNQCPICSNHRVLKGYNDLTTTRPDMAKDWHLSLNGDLKPEHVTEFSNKKVWWQCSKGHSYQKTVAKRAISSICPICSGRQLLLGVNDLVTLNKDIAAEWCYEKNGEMRPEQFTAITYKRVWWKCSKCSHEWDIPIRSRYLLGHGCPKCAGEKRWEKRRNNDS